MNRLRIVVEESAGEYRVLYCGHDAVKADAILKEPTSNDRALYVKPQPSSFNRPTISTAVEAVLPPPTPMESDRSDIPETNLPEAGETDAAAEAVAAPARGPRAARAARGPRK
jgi:hypothetical protein